MKNPLRAHFEKKIIRSFERVPKGKDKFPAKVKQMPSIVKYDKSDEQLTVSEAHHNGKSWWVTTISVEGSSCDPLGSYFEHSLAIDNNDLDKSIGTINDFSIPKLGNLAIDLSNITKMIERQQ